MEFTYLKQPSKRYTFEMPKLYKWVIQNCKGKTLNLFAGKVLLKGIDEIRIDLNKEMPADYYMDAYEFILIAKENGWKYDTVIFDPPYSLRKSREKYYGIYTSKLRKIKTILPELMNEGSYFINFGYSTNGMGKKRGFELIKICIINHSGDKDDTLCTIEIKTQNSINF